MQIFSAAITGLLIFLLASAGVFAQSTPAEFNALVSAKKTAEVEALARERTARNPKDDLAWWYLARVVADNAAKREQLQPGIENCVKELPLSARCQHALGTLYAALATSSGLTAGIKYASRIKDSFTKAVELAPQDFEMRRDLIQFYLQAPGLAGGSVRRAIEHAEGFAQFDPIRGKLLRADIHAYEKEWDRADVLVASVKPSADATLDRKSVV